MPYLDLRLTQWLHFDTVVSKANTLLMNIRTRCMIAACFVTSLLCGSPAHASGASPINLSEAQASIQAQGLDNTAMDYQQHFMASIAKPLDAAVKDGSAAAGKSSFDVIFVVTADGHIKDAFLTNPTKQSLGKYVSTKLVGVQAAKPPKDGWSVYVSMEHP